MYRAAFPGVTIIGTSATRDGIRDRVPTYVDQMKRFAPIDATMRVRLATGRMRDGSTMSDAARLTGGLTMRDYAEFMPEMEHTTPVGPDRIVDDSLTILLGRRRVQIVSPGRGNTAGDAFVFLPDERVLLTGDLVTVPAPSPAGVRRRLDAFARRAAGTPRGGDRAGPRRRPARRRVRYSALLGFSNDGTRRGPDRSRIVRLKAET